MPAADLVLTNANVITMDPLNPAAEMVAVKDGRIEYAGDRAGLDEFKGRRTRVIDCQGLTLVPGFNDAHCHVFSTLRKQLSVDLSYPSVKNIEDIKSAIRRKAEKTPLGEWITGSDYSDFHLAEKRHPTRQELDEAAPHHPVVVSHRSLHGCVLNSRALELADITRETEEPPGGRIERDVATGEPNGLLYDMLGYIRYRVMPSLSESSLEEAMKSLNGHYLSLGITSLQDATVTNDLRRWERYRGYIESGRLKPRLYLMTGSDNLPQFREAGLVTGAGDEKLRMGGLKVILSETPGRLYPPQEELNARALEAHRAGYQLAIHAMQPAAVEAAITALENIRWEAPEGRLRHRVEHCSECPPEMLERLQKTGPVIVSQPPFVHFSGERYLATISPEDFRWLYRFKSFLDSGLVVAGSSDSPIVPDNPLAGIYAAVTRRALTGEEILPEEGVSPEQALAMYTANAAFASGEEGIKGSLAAGKLADMALLSADPASVPPEEIKDIRVEKTIIGGEVVWER